MIAGLYQGSSYSMYDPRRSSAYLMEGFESEEEAWRKYRLRLLNQLDRHSVVILDWNWVTREVLGATEHLVPMRPAHKDDRVALFKVENGFITKNPFRILDARKN